MGLEHILRTMQAQADGEIATILRAAEEEASQLIAEAENEAHAIRARHQARVEPRLSAQMASLRNKAKLNALRTVANAREQLLVEAFTQAEACLEQIRESKEYVAIFLALAREAVGACGEDLIACVDPRDIALAHRTFAELGMNAEIEPQPIRLGGLEVMTRDRRVVVVNTLAARLDRTHKILRSPVAAILLGKSEGEWKPSTAMPMPA